jgi:hypothetical protein
LRRNDTGCYFVGVLHLTQTLEPSAINAPHSKHVSLLTMMVSFIRVHGKNAWEKKLVPFGNFRGQLSFLSALWSLCVK